MTVLERHEETNNVAAMNTVRVYICMVSINGRIYHGRIA